MEGDKQQDAGPPGVEKGLVQNPEHDGNQAEDDGQKEGQATEPGHDENRNAKLGHGQDQDQPPAHIDFVTLGMFIIGEPPTPARLPIRSTAPLSTMGALPSVGISVSSMHVLIVTVCP